MSNITLYSVYCHLTVKLKCPDWQQYGQMKKKKVKTLDQSKGNQSIISFINYSSLYQIFKKQLSYLQSFVKSELDVFISYAKESKLKL